MEKWIVELMLLRFYIAHESEKWEMEYRHLNERHQLAKTQLKETFFLQRSQMLSRHQKVSLGVSRRVSRSIQH